MIPYSIFPSRMVEKGSIPFLRIAKKIEIYKPGLELYLKRANLKIKGREFIAQCVFSDIILFSLIFVMILAVTAKEGLAHNLLLSLIVSTAILIIIFFQQMTYPQYLMNKKVADIDRNLLSALRTMRIQVKSGISLFDILSSIAKEDYGGVSKVMGIAVDRINTGTPQIKALEIIAIENPSLNFQRVIWQIVTAMKAGADLNDVLSEIVKALEEEQIVQVQEYGSKLNPLTMFYMLMVVIVPALSVTFLVVLSSFIALSSSSVSLIFWSLYFIVLIFQIFFLSLISSKRPNLLGD